MARRGTGRFIGTLALAVYLSMPPVVTAQDRPPVDCRLEVSRAAVTFGDSLTVTCDIAVPPGYRITDPILMGTGIPDGMSSRWQRSETDPGGATVTRYGFLIHAFVPDSLLIGPVRFDAAAPDGGSFTVHSDSLVIAVGTVLAASDSTLVPDRRPVTIAARGIPGWLVALAVAIAVLIAATLYYRFRKRRAAAPAPVTEAPIDEVGEFVKIAALALYEKGKHKDHYVLISSALRNFLQRNMPFDARHETTTEIVRELDKTEYDAAVRDAIRDMLGEADRVMFAKYIPSRDEASSAVDRAIKPVRAILYENSRRLEAAIRETTETESAADESPENGTGTAAGTAFTEPGGVR